MTARRSLALFGSLLLLLGACDGDPSLDDGGMNGQLDDAGDTLPDGGGLPNDGGGGDTPDAAHEEDGGSSSHPDGGGSSNPDGGGSSCTDACAPSEERCSGADIQRCIIDPDTRCTVWAAPEPCADGLFCSGGECTSSCTDSCAEGERRCASSSGYQVCTVQSSGCTEWGPESACPSDQVCTTGGVCMACTEGAERCGPSGNVETCIGGRWALTATCPFGCDSTGPSCHSDVTCVPGAYRCNGTNVETCNATGTAWLHVSSCTVGCSAGLCTGACTPGATRCNAGGVETCDSTGTSWTLTETCTTFCEAGVCALDGLEIAADQTLEGEILVDGPVVVRSGATLTSATGSLTIRASSITVEADASISVAPTGESPQGAGFTGNSSVPGGTGGGYGTYGAGNTSSRRGPQWGSDVDADVQPGSPGGRGYSSSTTAGSAGGKGGGVLRLIADTITIHGQLTANGQAGSDGTHAGGGGSGGGILIAGDVVRIGGAVSAVGGSGGRGPYSYHGYDGGDGRVKILYGAELDTTGASISGALTQGLLPPLVIRSSTHPNPDRIYNDGFELVALSWERPFAPLSGYYWRVGRNIAVPTPANATFVASELVAFPRSLLVEGDNLFQLVSVDPTITVGGVESWFRIRYNTTPPALSSSSHPATDSWSTNRDIFVSWTLPHADENYRGIYYLFDQYGDTIPDETANFVPITQKQVLLSGTANGVWAFHIVSVDSHGYLTRTASHYRFRIGPDPGSGTVFGQVVDATTSDPIGGATVSINRDLFPSQQTTSGGSFNFQNIPAGTYELRITHPDYQTAVRTVTVTADGTTASNVSLMPN